MSKNQSYDYLADHGKTLIDHGYNIVPIIPGKKSPIDDGWSKVKATPKVLSDWLANGYANFGVGIQTRDTPAIDLDISDERIAKKMRDWCEMNIGEAPVRVGRAPRQLLLFRCDEPFRKMKSGKYADEWGDEHEIEILGDGQQFVAYAIHPDVHKPFEWITETDPTNTHASDLPVLTVEDAKALLAYFAEVATAEGWERVSKGISGGARAIDTTDDPFADVESVVDIPADELRNRLMLIPGAEQYDMWVQVGMALFHQFAGDEEGLRMWHEWSEVADNYEPDALEKHWKSFNIEGKGRAPITARFIIKMAKEATTDQLINRANELRDEFFAAKDEKTWRELCIKAKRAELDAIARAQIAEIAKKSYTTITGEKISIVEVRRAIAFELTAVEKTPAWCKGWVFDASNDRFFHTETKVSMSIQGFNAVFSRQALTKKDILEGRSSPSNTPADLALNIYRVVEVIGTNYAPGKDKVFYRDGIRVANTYPEYQVPKVPEELTPQGKLAIKTVKRHIKHILDDEWEQRLFLNWLAWIVQNPGKLLKWAMVLQGVEGDGKSYFGVLLRAVMGVSNVKMLNASVLESNFNGWAQGQCVLVIEEPRLQGHNRYDVINRIKPLITNTIIPIHAKGKEAYDVENTTNYYLPTNFRDALPLNDNDRRYCVLFSRWQNREALRQFKEEHPDYYSDLYAAIEESAPSIRKWLIEHEIDGDFPANADAPITRAHSYMVQSAKPEPIRVIEEVIAEGEYPDITADLVNATSLPDAMIGRDTDLPQTQGLTRLLEHNGYIFLDKIRVDGKYGRFWSKAPDMFRDGTTVSVQKIRRYVEERKKIIEANTL